MSQQARSSRGPQATGLLTDLYQLTMAQGYHALGQHEREAVFHLYFRKLPFQSGYAISCGLHSALEQLADFRFDPDDVQYLSSLTARDQSPLFHPAFLDYLANLELTVDIDALPEGTVCFPHEPMLRVRGPLAQAQLIETLLLNTINFQSLIATKASRIVAAASGAEVLEFGLRRAQGPDGGVAASRAAYIGGCAATSNVMAGKRFGIPVRGTHAHSWVMCFEDELTAFREYAAVMPNNCTFLVDTYDTLTGVRHAIQVGHELRQRGHELLGIRLDSGDIADLSLRARELLDAAGFPNATIVASDDLDEHRLTELNRRGAKIGVWGVGTRLVTAFDQPALGGVYKLAALAPLERHARTPWEFKLKLSEAPEKASIAGVLDIARFEHNGQIELDLLYDASLTPAASSPPDASDAWRGLPLSVAHAGRSQAEPAALRPPAGASWRSLLEPVMKGGSKLESGDAHSARARAARELQSLPYSARQLAGSAPVDVGLERELWQMNQRLRAELAHKNQMGSK